MPDWKRQAEELRTKLNEPLDSTPWTSTHLLKRVHRSGRNLEAIDCGYLIGRSKGWETTDLLVDLCTSIKYRPVRCGWVGCLGTRSAWFSFGQDRLLDIVDWAYLLGRADPTEPAKCKHLTQAQAKHALGNSMHIPCVIPLDRSWL